MHLTLWYIVFICHQNDIYENYIGSVYVGGYCGLSQSGLCVFGKVSSRLSCSLSMFVGFVVVMSYVECGDDG